MLPDFTISSILGDSLGNEDTLFTPGTIINGNSRSYEVLKFLGQGSFGKVVKCLELSSRRYVAIKASKTALRYVADAQNESDTLSSILREDPEENNIVRFIESFHSSNRFCIVTECLDINLQQFLQKQNSFCLHLKQIQHISKQLFTAFRKLKTIGIVHTDLKPENIMLVDHIGQPGRIKVIDFGLASGNQCNQRIVQPLQYRAPEVLFGFSYNYAIDMWSIGCIMAEMYLGCPLYDGRSTDEQILMITKTLHVPLEYNIAIDRALEQEYRNNYGPLNAEQRAAITTRAHILIGLASGKILRLTDENFRRFYSIGTPQDEIILLNNFVDLLFTILAVDDRVRCDPQKALESLFIEEEIDVVN